MDENQQPSSPGLSLDTVAQARAELGDEPAMLLPCLCRRTGNAEVVLVVSEKTAEGLAGMLGYFGLPETVAIFANHPINQARRQAGRLPVTNFWLWGLGRVPQLSPFAETYGARGAMITAVDLLRGLGRLLGWRRIDVPGATGYLDTDYAAKGRHAVEALRDPATDLVCVHVEAPDEASHEGNASEKVKSLERISQDIVEPIHAALREHGKYRILVSPDHPTYCRTKTHEHGDVPLAVAGRGIEPDAATTYDDPTAAQSELAFPEGWRLMEWFLGRA